jgi:hypothetical protein
VVIFIALRKHIHALKGLPAELRKALNQLAGTPELKLLQERIYSDIAAIVENDEQLELPDISPHGNFDWEEGVEEYSIYSEDELWAQLGVADKTLPYFNSHIDTLGIHNPWENPDFFSDESQPDRVELVIRWHQLVGILKGLRQIFDNRPLLLMDEVGFGKTIQVVGVIAMLAWFRSFYSTKNHFPGAFSKSIVF